MTGEEYFMTDQTTRDHIIEAADELFYRQGYAHTSFADIADALQISAIFTITSNPRMKFWMP